MGYFRHDKGLKPLGSLGQARRGLGNIAPRFTSCLIMFDNSREIAPAQALVISVSTATRGGA